LLGEDDSLLPNLLTMMMKDLAKGRIAADPVDLGPSRPQPGAQPGRRCLHRSSGAAGRPDAGG
jgi:hypothetical protein